MQRARRRASSGGRAPQRRRGRRVAPVARDLGHLAHALLCSLVRTSGVCASRNGNTPGVTDWQEQDDALVREFELPSFPAAIDFVDRLAELAEGENHHPDIDIRYRKVTVRWTTHSEGGVTAKDRDMAERTSALIAA